MTEQLIGGALEVARAGADAAAATLEDFHPDSTTVRRKADRSPVTDADQAAERVIRERIETAFPDHAIWGEEYGRDRDDAGNLWLIDPIDGTKSWIRGLPFWSIQIALRHRGRLVVGVSCAPALAETAWAASGHGAWLNGERLAVSDVTGLRDCDLSTGNLMSLAADAEAWARVARLHRDCHRVRGYGDYYHYHRLAAGELDAVIESDVNILDIAALAVIVREAGGVFTDLDGGDIDLATTTVRAAATPALHHAIGEALGLAS